MGLGDGILAAGQAKKLGKAVKIGDGKRIDRNPLYAFIPYVNDSGEWFIDYTGHRGYIKRVEGDRVIFNRDYRAEPAIIELEPIVTDYVIVEPRIKSGAPPAKLWHHYDKVVAECDYKFLTFNAPFAGCDCVQTDVITAARYIAGCRAYLGAEGLLHHLAAAFNKPAVVVIGAYSPPEVVGYSMHRNISVDDPDELGHRKRTGAMDGISPDEVIEALADCCG